MRKIVRKLSLIALSLALVLGGTVSAFASSDSENAHFTFTNAYINEPDLYVTKTVSSAVEGYTVPEDTEFTFILKWDQDGDGVLEFASNEIYYLYENDGAQVTNSAGGYTFRTGSDGSFTLKAGQYAKFEWAGTVDYEITEVPLTGFTQTEPAGGEAATGTVDENGTTVTFANVYIPDNPEGDTTTLSIRKDITWPSGYEQPDLSDAEFTFKVTIDGSAYNGETYTIYDTASGNSVSTGRTDSDGQLTISGGQTAQFSDVEVGVDYKVEEVSEASDGWYSIGSTSTEGATTSPIVYTTFANATADFAVAKTRYDGVTGTDDEYTFTLKDEEGNAVSGSAYYLYDSSGNLINEEALTTNEDGQFTLKVGQKVLFVGLTVGEEYTVSEDEVTGYEKLADQTEKVDGSGSSVDTLLFANVQLSDVTIVKYDSKKSKTLSGAEFSIYKSGDYDPATLTANQDAEAIQTITTGDDGSATFTELAAGTYLIVETKSPEDYLNQCQAFEVTVPYELSDSEAADVDDFDATADGVQYNSSKGIYYLYSLTYDVTNVAELIMPSTGSHLIPIYWWVIIGCAVVAAGLIAFRYVRRRGGKRA